MATDETGGTTDDRGNVVDISSGEDRTGRIDREAEPLPGLDFEFGYGWVGGIEEMRIAINDGYAAEVATALICGLLRSEPEASEDARNFFTAFVNS